MSKRKRFIIPIDIDESSIINPHTRIYDTLKDEEYNLKDTKDVLSIINLLNELYENQLTRTSVFKYDKSLLDLDEEIFQLEKENRLLFQKNMEFYTILQEIGDKIIENYTMNYYDFVNSLKVNKK